MGHRRKVTIMGCDIHLDVEVRQANGSWAVVPKPSKAHVGRFQYQPDHYDGRDYRLFGVLAGVRDSTVEEISPPKGVPADTSADFLARVIDWDLNGHSHSWHTLRALLDYDWDAVDVHPVFYGLMLRMWRWANGDPDAIRIVFFFDN